MCVCVCVCVCVIYLANPKIPVESRKIEGAYSISLLYLISFYDMTTLSLRFRKILALFMSSGEVNFLLGRAKLIIIKFSF